MRRALVYRNWIDSHRRVDEGATVRNCRMNRLLFTGELVLHVWIFNRVFSPHLIGFMMRANKQERKSTLKRLRYCVFQDPKAVYSASKGKYTTAGGDVQVS